MAPSALLAVKRLAGKAVDARTGEKWAARRRRRIYSSCPYTPREHERVTKRCVRHHFTVINDPVSETVNLNMSEMFLRRSFLLKRICSVKKTVVKEKKIDLKNI